MLGGYFTRRRLMAELLAERLSGRPAASYESPAMAWGKAHEAAARAAYSARMGVEVSPVGLIRHPRLKGALI